MASLFTSALVLGSAVAMTAPQAASPRPVALIVEPVGADLRVTVTGRAESDINVRYRIEASSGAHGGGNRSSQSGATILRAGAPATLLRLTLGGAATADWRVVLDVQPEGHSAYQIIREGKSGG